MNQTTYDLYQDYKEGRISFETYCNRYQKLQLMTDNYITDREAKAAENVPHVSPGSTVVNSIDKSSPMVGKVLPRETYRKTPGQDADFVRERAARRTMPTKLNLGCGYTLMDDAVNVDRMPKDSIPALEGRWYRDLDIDNDSWCLALPYNHFTDLYASHVIEHLQNPLQFMEACWRLAAPDALFTLRTPYGSSDDAWEDQTHVRAYLIGSWNAFSQEYYWNKDYGYGGDWKVSQVILFIPESRWPKKKDEKKALAEALRRTNTRRNFVQEMVVQLQAVKPVRIPEPGKQMAGSLPLTFQVIPGV